jgi:hypothetical protein
MFPHSFRSPFQTGALFGACCGGLLLIFLQTRSWWHAEAHLPYWLLDLSYLSLLAASLWSSFLWFNRRRPRLPAHFPFHLVVGLGFSFSAAMLTALISYGALYLDPTYLDQLLFQAQHEWLDRGVPLERIAERSVSYAYQGSAQYALAAYSRLFLSAFGLTLLLSTASCIWECLERAWREEELV